MLIEYNIHVPSDVSLCVKNTLDSVGGDYNGTN